MGVKPGYKQTEAGVIPEVWLILTADSLCERIQDGTHFSPQVRGGSYLYITSRNIREGALDLRNAQWIDEAQHRTIYRRCDTKLGDILLTKDGANTGNAALNNIPEEISLLSSVAFLRFIADRHDARFFLQQILGSALQRQIADAMSGNAITRLTLKKVRALRFVVPPLREQEAIAEALSDVDALIESLEKLIEKKRAIKQGAMQELLTGKQRLPGFTGKWEEKRLGEVARLYQPQTISADQFKANGYPVYGANGIVGYYDRFNHDEWQITVTCRGSTCGTVNRTEGKAWITGNAMVVAVETEGSSVDQEFLFYLLENQDLSVCITGTGQPQIVRRPLARFPLSFPSSLAEQNAIAITFADMNAELLALDQRRIKAHLLKQGMMQELLTGRVRLV